MALGAQVGDNVGPTDGADVGVALGSTVGDAVGPTDRADVGVGLVSQVGDAVKTTYRAVDENFLWPNLALTEQTLEL